MAGSEEKTQARENYKNEETNGILGKIKKAIFG